MKTLSIVGLLGLATLTSGLSAQTVVSTNITSDTTWSGTVILEGPIFVTGGAELNILPGTIVRGQPRRGAGEAVFAAPGSLIVTQTGTINASGNAANPIIFTTAAIDNDSNGIPDSTGGTYLDGWTSGAGDTFYDADPVNSPLGPLAAGPIPGASGAPDANVELWGGIVVLGKAPTNLGTVGNAKAKVGNIEGLTPSTLTEYGGDLPNDNSGVLRYLSVRHGGDELGSGNEINGITLGGVGYGTTIEYCEVYMNWDDGYEIFGGTVNTNHLVVTFAGDDSFDGDQGWTGQNQFWVAVLPYFDIGSENGDEGFEFDGDDSGDRNVDLSGLMSPFSNYTVYNATVVGSAGATGQSNADNGRLLFKSNFSGQVVNTIVVNTGTVAGVEDQTGYPVVLESCTFDNTGTLVTDNGSGTNVINNIVDNSGAFTGLKGDDQSIAGGLDLRPNASFSGVSSTVVVPAGYEQVTYRGAIDPATPAGGTWLAGWTVLSINGVLVD